MIMLTQPATSVILRMSPSRGFSFWSSVPFERKPDLGTHGGPLFMTSDEARFWSKVEKSEGCWIWTGAKTMGYGRFMFNGKSVIASRMAHYLAHGEMPSQFVCHHCDNPACVRPDHLFVGTAMDNNRDAILKGRLDPGMHHRTKTHCKFGHPYDEENTYQYTTPSGGPGRGCLICTEKRQRARYKTHYFPPKSERENPRRSRL